MVTRIPHHSDPELDARVRALLAAAAAPTEPGPLPGEPGAVAAFRDARSTPSRRFSMSSSLTPVRAAVAAGLGAGVLLAASVGAAAAGVLPGAAQDTARSWLDTVGVEVPGADARSAGHADQRGASADGDAGESTERSTETDLEATETEATEAGDGETGSTGAEPPEASEHGRTVSGTARETEAEGADKGAEVAATASEGRSRAGEQGGPGAPATGEAPADEGAGTQAAEGQARADAAGQGRRDHGGDRRP